MIMKIDIMDNVFIDLFMGFRHKRGMSGEDVPAEPSNPER